MQNLLARLIHAREEDEKEKEKDKDADDLEDDDLDEDDDEDFDDDDDDWDDDDDDDEEKEGEEEAGAERLGYGEDRARRADDRRGAVGAGLEDEVRGCHTGRVPHAAHRVPSGLHPEAACGVRIEQVAPEHAALDDGATRLPHALAVKR